MSLEDLVGRTLTGEEFNQILKERKLTLEKFFNTKELHNGYQYTNGHNVDPSPFNSSRECQKGGFYFFANRACLRTIWSIHFKISHKREISIPDDAQVYIEKDKCKSDKLVLGERTDLSEEECIFYFQMIDDCLKTQEMCIKVLEREPMYFNYVPNKYKTPEMCENVVERYPQAFQTVPIECMTQEMCETVAEINPFFLERMPDKFKTREMCKRAARKISCCQRYFPDRFKESSTNEESYYSRLRI